MVLCWWSRLQNRNASRKTYTATFKDVTNPAKAFTYTAPFAGSRDSNVADPRLTEVLSALKSTQVRVLLSGVAAEAVHVHTNGCSVGHLQFLRGAQTPLALPHSGESADSYAIALIYKVRVNTLPVSTRYASLQGKPSLRAAWL